MLKALLVIDMPEIDEQTKNGCRNCKFARKRMTLSEEYLCSITEQSAYVYDMKCPLKPMPEKKQKDNSNELNLGYELGWNNCINEILGEEQ